MKMKAGEIGEDGQLGFAAAGFAEQSAPSAIERGHLVQDFEQADQRDFGGIYDDFDSRFAHLRAAHADRAIP